MFWNNGGECSLMLRVSVRGLFEFLTERSALFSQAYGEASDAGFAGWGFGDFAAENLFEYGGQRRFCAENCFLPFPRESDFRVGGVEKKSVAGFGEGRFRHFFVGGEIAVGLVAENREMVCGALNA